MSIERIHPSGAVKPRGPYSPAVRAGDFIYVSGQGPTDPLQDRIVEFDIRPQTRQTILNLQVILEAAGASLADVVKCSVFLKHAGDFQAMGFRNHAQSDPDAQYVWWHSGSPVNFGRINDPEVDRLIELGDSQLDDAARAATFRQLGARLQALQPVLWLGQRTDLMAVRRDLRGLRPSVVGFDLARIWREPVKARP